ncbi:MAG: HAMP domain-containing histidine kinase [Planctomycetes bacterium]|nr:HAMP domain-containing histidine kinase [Planctomycetota bacterium]
MDRSVRIAVVGPVDERLVGDLRQLPLQPEVRPMPTLLGDGEALLRYQPDLLLIAFGPRPDEDVGAARLLQRMWPALGVVVVARPDQELAAAPVARRLNARVLLYPDAPGHVAATIEQVLQGSDRPRPELFVDLAHGLADEINNPLMFASGHLQLLRAALDPQRDRDRRDQVDAALAGLDRIHTSVERLRRLSQAADGPRRREPVDVAQLIAEAIAARTPGTPTATIALPHGAQVVNGDREQLQLAMAAMVRFADELAGLDTDCHLSLQQEGHALRLRLVARGQGLAGWRLPQTFEPFYPQRALRGQSHGLGLFLLQTVILGHKGQATARRTPDGALQFDFLLPS